MDFADVEVLLDNPKLKRPVRCGKKFSKGAARKLKASEIIFICKGGGKYAELGRQECEKRLNYIFLLFLDYFRTLILYQN